MLKSIKHKLRDIYQALYPRVGARITAPFLLIVFIVAGIAVFIMTRLVAGGIDERLNNQLITSAQAASNTITEIEQQQLETLRLMTFTQQVDEAIVEKDTEQLALLLEPIAANEASDSVIVFDADGVGIVELRRLDETRNVDYVRLDSPDLSEWESVQHILQEDADDLGDKYAEVRSVENTTLLYITAPVFDQQGNLVGGISLGITLEHFASLLSEQTLAAIVLYEPNGEVIIDTFPGIGTQELALSSQQTTILATTVQDKTVVQDHDFDVGSYRILYTFLRLRSKEIGVMGVGLPSTFVTDQIGTNRNTLIVMFSGMFFGTALLGILVTRSISKPIANLVQTTRAIHGGDLTRRAGLKMPDEIGELSVSFDKMTEQLIERNRTVNALYLAQLEETARREAILSNITDSVVLLDSEGELLLANEAASKLVEELEYDIDLHEQFWQICWNPFDYFNSKLVAIGKYDFNISAAPVQMESGEQLGHVVVFHDITPIIEAERLKNKILLQLSHELRTPLTAAMGYQSLVVMMGKDELNKQNQTYLENVGYQLRVLSRMINQVIDVNSIVANTLAIEKYDTNLTELIREVTDDYQERIIAKGLQFLISMPKEQIWIIGDRLRFSKTFEEILDNAYRYTLEGAIKVQLMTKDSQVYIIIRDSGVGIDEDEIERVTEMMYRGRSAEAGPTDARGLGLGLFYALHIIEAHQGYLRIVQNDDGGISVGITLPVTSPESVSS